MKSHMKMRVLSFVTAFSMLLSLSATALAASFDDLQDAINGNTSNGVAITDSGHDNHWGYSQNPDGSFGIESWDTDDGRNIQLNEDVTYEWGKDHNSHIFVGGDQDVNLDGQNYEVTGAWWEPVFSVDNGTLNMTDTKVTGGQVGVEVINGGEFVMNGNSDIHDNKHDDWYKDGNGGGVRVDGEGSSFVMNGGSIHNNTVTGEWNHGGGVSVTNGGEFVMNSGDVRENDANFGGGVYINNGAAEMNGGHISNNHANHAEYGQGGGVLVDSGKFIMNTSGSNINANTAVTDGGGIYNHGYVELNNGYISSNKAGGNGAGVYNDGDLVLNGVYIQVNTSVENGAGVYNAGNFVMNGGGVNGNKVTGSWNQGGGVVVADDSNFVMNAGNINGNSADFGGGIYVDGGSAEINGGNIANNKAQQSEWGQGGGVLVDNGKLVMNGGSIHNNTAVNSGGGIYNRGEVNLTGGEVTDNAAEKGAGIYSVGELTMSGGSVSSNTAEASGGGIFVDGSSRFFFDVDGNRVGGFVMTGGSVNNNTALTGEGGGIFIAGTVEISGGSIVGNRTLTDDDLGGGGIFVKGYVTDDTCGELTLKNAIITQNFAGTAGGGLAGCTTGRVFVFGINGAAIYDNMTNGLDNYTGVNDNADNNEAWNALSDEEKSAFIAAAKDIFTAGLSSIGDGSNAGAVIGNVMLGVTVSDPSNPTAEEFAQMAANLANWSGYTMMDGEDKLNSVGPGNNGTVYGSKFVVLTANPSEETKAAAMEVLGLTETELAALIDLLSRNIAYSTEYAENNSSDIDVMGDFSFNPSNGVLIAGNVSLNNFGGGIANNGILHIGEETIGITGSPEIDFEKNLDSDDENVTIENQTFRFELLGSDGETVVNTFENDSNGHADIKIPYELISDLQFAEGETSKTLVFYVREVNDGQENVEYDNTLYRVVIVLTADEITGSIGQSELAINGIVISDAVIEKSDDNGETWTVAEDGIVFDNTYTSPEEPPKEPEPPEDPEDPPEEPPEDPEDPPEEPPEDPEDPPEEPPEDPPENPPTPPGTPFLPPPPEDPPVKPEKPVEEPEEDPDEPPVTPEEPEEEDPYEPPVVSEEETDEPSEENESDEIVESPEMSDEEDINDNRIPTDTIPQTGDNFNIALWGSIIAISAIGCVIVLRPRKKSE